MPNERMAKLMLRTFLRQVQVDAKVDQLKTRTTTALIYYYNDDVHVRSTQGLLWSKLVKQLHASSRSYGPERQLLSFFYTKIIL